jgi:hypothetical protein
MRTYSIALVSSLLALQACVVSDGGEDTDDATDLGEETEAEATEETEADSDGTEADSGNTESDAEETEPDPVESDAEETETEPDGGGGEMTDEPDGGSPDEPETDGGSDDAAVAVTLPELSNLDEADLPDAPEGDLRISADCEIDTDSGELDCSGAGEATGDLSFTIAEPEGGFRFGVMRVNSLQIDMGASLSVTGALPLVLVASDTVRVFGSLSVSASGANAVAGGSTGGEGLGAGIEGDDRPDSGGGYCGVGGDGVTEDGATDVPGGETYGSETLVPLLGGSGGGHNGGAGGGALQVVAGSEIQVGLTGSLEAGGGGGKNGGGGGGSGGAILLEAPSVKVEGMIAANGGGGGASQGGNGGKDATANDTPAPSENPELGGSGSAGDDPNGASGIYDTTNSTPGGGGGAGRIRINTADGTVELSGTLSPSEASGCATFGTLP